MTRASQANVQFLHPFLLSELEGPQPAVTYRLTDEGELSCLSFITFRTVLAMLQLQALGRPTPISLDDFYACICASRLALASDAPRLAAPVA